MNKLTLAGLLILIAGVALLGVYYLDKDQSDINQSAEVTSNEEKPLPPQPVAVEARWLLAGEVFWGRQMQRIAEAQPNTYEYLFQKLDTLDRDQYDAWLAHMECPITDADISFEDQANALIFNCQPEYLEEFSRWFDAVSLANNHMDNVNGVAGLNQTRENLESVKVQYYGHFDNAIKDDICEIVSLPVRVVYNDGQTEDESFPVALCGYHNVWRLPTTEELAQIGRYAEYFFTIASPQQGAEYQPSADQFKTETYRAMIDAGADLVVGSHPHWVQNTEVYKGKLIVYSTGNFMFDQEWSEEVKRGVAIDMSFRLELGPLVDSLIGLDCSKFKDDCLEQAQELGLKTPAIKPAYELVSVYHQGGQTAKALSDVHELNLLRTNWEDTMKALQESTEG